MAMAEIAATETKKYLERCASTTQAYRTRLGVQMLDTVIPFSLRMRGLFLAQRGEGGRQFALPPVLDHLRRTGESTQPVMARTLGGFALGFVDREDPFSVVEIPAFGQRQGGDLGLEVNFAYGRQVDHHVTSRVGRGGGGRSCDIAPSVEPLDELSVRIDLGSEPAGPENFANRLTLRGCTNLVTGWNDIHGLIDTLSNAHDGERHALRVAASTAIDAMHEEMTR
jgi:hypothetical protein